MTVYKILTSISKYFLPVSKYLCFFINILCQFTNIICQFRILQKFDYVLENSKIYKIFNTSFPLWNYSSNFSFIFILTFREYSKPLSSGNLKKENLFWVIGQELFLISSYKICLMSHHPLSLFGHLFRKYIFIPKKFKIHTKIATQLPPFVGISILIFICYYRRKSHNFK